MQITLAQIPNALETRLGIPRPDWDLIADWVASSVPEGDLNEAWTELSADWVDHLVAALPKGHARTESPHFTLLSIDDARYAERLLHWCEQSRLVILETLDGVANDEGYGKQVVLAFSNTEAYYDYVADYFPDEGEFAPTAGLFLGDGYGHLALCEVDSYELDRVIAHELNHAMLRHLPLPLWLNEGVTQVIEDLVVESSRFTVDREIVQRHRQYWNADTIHTFWSGDSFHSPDEGQELSYHLSQVLFRNLMSDFPKRVLDFLNSAEYSDAGRDALNRTCGLSLGTRVTQFLGEGNWEPRADYHEDTAMDVSES